MEKLIHERKIGNVLIQTYVAEEYTPPEDVFYFQEDIDAVHSGELDYFHVTVKVCFGLHTGIDRLGCCTYRNCNDFIGTAEWRDMVCCATKACRFLHR